MTIYEKTNEYVRKGTPMVLVLVIEKVGEGPATVGNKMLVTDTDAFGTVGGGALEYNAQEHCKTILKTKQSETKSYLLNEGKIMKDTTTLNMACGGKVTLFFEYIGPAEHIYIFGAGHCGQALSNVLSTLNYYVTVIDHRKDVVSAFTGGNKVVLSPFVEYIEDNKLVEDSFVVVATPSHKYDYAVVDKLLEKKTKLKYIGMLCSKKKLKEYLDITYETFGNDVDLSHFYAPVGLDTGGGSPEEIAISIASEILSVSNNKKNHNHMRESFTGNRYWEK